MKRTKAIIVSGIIITVFGSIFHLQGQAVVGPKSSFMYSNPDWVNYGIQIIITGIIIIGIGIGLVFKKD